MILSLTTLQQSQQITLFHPKARTTNFECHCEEAVGDKAIS